MVRKTVLLVAFVLLLSMFSLSASGAQAGKVSVQTLSEMIDSKQDFLLLDLRKANDYSECHIPGAINADMDSAVSFNDYATSTKVLKEVLKAQTGSMTGEGKTMVLACYTGNRYANAAVSILSSLGRDLSDVYILEGGNQAWNAHKEKAEVKVQSQANYDWGDTFDFSRRRADSNMSLYNAMDIMSISTPCAFESYAAEVGFEGSYTELVLVANNSNDTVTDLQNGFYSIEYTNGAQATGERRWPTACSFSDALPAFAKGKGLLVYSAYDESLLVIEFLKMDEQYAKEYCALLKKAFPIPAEGQWDEYQYRGSNSSGLTVSFSYPKLSIALEF